MKIINVLLLSTVALGCLSNGAVAQFRGGFKYATTSAVISPSAIKHGATGQLIVSINVASGYHINSVHPDNPDLIATLVTVTSDPGMTLGKAVYPPSKVLNEPAISPTPLLVYTGKNRVIIPLSINKTATRGQHIVTVTVSYQGCNASACFPPKSDTILANVLVR